MLEIYLPDSAQDVDTYFEADTPFMNISVGDLLNSRTWETGHADGKLHKVTKLEHIIWKADNEVKHKLCVFTTLVDDSAEERLKK